MPSKCRQALKRGPGRPIDPGLAKRRRSELVHAAFGVFAEKGYHAATITDITEAANLGRATFYLHFKSKREVLDDVIDYIAGKGLESLPEMNTDQRIGSTTEIENSIAAIVDRSLALRDEFPGALRILLSEGTLDEEMARRIFGMGDHFEAFLSKLISEGIAAGLFRPEVEADFAAHALVGLATAALLRVLRDTLTHDSRDQYVESLVAFIKLLLVPGV